MGRPTCCARPDRKQPLPSRKSTFSALACRATLKSLGDSLKTLVALEREAFSLDLSSQGLQGLFFVLVVECSVLARPDFGMLTAFVVTYKL